MSRLRPLLLLLLCAGLPACSGEAEIPIPVFQESPADYVDLVNGLHLARVERLDVDRGWLTLIGLHRLHDGENFLGNGGGEIDWAPGLPARHARIEITAEGIMLDPLEAGLLQVDGSPIEGPTPMAGHGLTEAPILSSGSVSAMIILRQGGWFLRVWDSESPMREAFTEIPRWPVDMSWRIVGRYIPYAEAKRVEVPNIQGWASEDLVYGEARFTIGEKEYVLYPLGTPDSDLFFVFGDATNAGESYGGGRFLYSPPPKPGGAVVLDFNLAYNPPCVFTAFATCPLPLEGNTLPFPIPAGEKVWEDGVGH